MFDEDAVQSLPKDLLLNWDVIKQRLIIPAFIQMFLPSGTDAKSMNEEEAMNLLPELYCKLLELISSVKEISLSFGKHTQIRLRTSDNMNLIAGLLPSKKDITDFIKSIKEGSLSLFSKEECKILMVGLDSSGKTTMLYKLKLGEVVTTIPTIGFNVETIEHRSPTNLQITTWDVGGQDRIRPLWRHYYEGINAVVYVVDSNDRERLTEAKNEMSKVLGEVAADLPLIVICNKQDLPNAMSFYEIKNGLDLYSVGSRPCEALACCAVTGDGLYEMLDWIASNRKK